MITIKTSYQKSLSKPPEPPSLNAGNRWKAMGKMPKKIRLITPNTELLVYGPKVVNRS